MSEFSFFGRLTVPLKLHCCPKKVVDPQNITYVFSSYTYMIYMSVQNLSHDTVKTQSKTPTVISPQICVNQYIFSRISSFWGPKISVNLCCGFYCFSLHPRLTGTPEDNKKPWVFHSSTFRCTQTHAASEYAYSHTYVTWNENKKKNSIRGFVNSSETTHVGCSVLKLYSYYP